MQHSQSSSLPRMPEIASVCFAVEDELTHPIGIASAVQALAPGAEIILYGSHARGTAHVDSDWDFLILLPAPVD